MDRKDTMDKDRRRFLVGAGKLAAVTPPTIALLLAAEGRNYAYAGSGAHWNGGSASGAKGNNGHHFGWHRNRKED